jgi:integrase
MSRALVDYQAEYLQLRHVMGHKLTGHRTLISGFLTDLTAAGGGPITPDAAVRWACTPRASIRTRAARLAVIRGFATYVHSHDPSLATLIPDGLIPARLVRTVPYIYTATQISALMAAALTLRPVLRGLTLSTVIGLMAATGLRISECLALNIDDVDTTDHVLAVIGKRGHRRLVPLHPSSSTALLDYLRLSRTLITDAEPGAFFLNINGGRTHPGNVEVAFRVLTEQLGYHPRPGGNKPRLHDLRHSMATYTLIQAHLDGVDVDARIAVLATYLGHVSPASTYWYLTGTPELLAFAAGKVAAAQQQAGQPS